MRTAGFAFFIFWLMLFAVNAVAQPGTTIDLKKPAKYENRTLGSESTKEGKIGKTKKFFQNTFSHYNYYFNAKTELDAIIARAKLGFRDDYTKLLPFYDYSLDVTATDPYIDSIIYKCNAGILLHDLRSDWVDDLYFLMGKAYYLRKNFDSAQHVFLYINYAFAPKDDGYDIPIGSNANGNVFSIATIEKTGLKEKLSKPPRRNQDIIWVAKNYMQTGNSVEASAILQILRNDPNFPERLQPELHEALGYLFFTQKLYDSAAYHLSVATDLDNNKQEKARREFLTAQLYMLSGAKESAQKYFARSADHAIDPIMEVYANLNAIDASEDTVNTIDKKIAALLHLAQKDRFVGYRDLIYYTAATAEMQRKNYADAYTDLKKSIKYNIANPAQRSQAFMLLGDISYLKPDYLAARNFYDSVESGSLKTPGDQQRLATRLPPLELIAANLLIIHNEDSLQAIARLSESQRNALIKKLVRQMRKAQGLKDQDSSVFINPAVQLSGTGSTNAAASADLFASPVKGDWYFNNTTLRTSGSTSFHSTWGNRPNVDNWQRIDAVNKQIAQVAASTDPDGAAKAGINQDSAAQAFSAGKGEISFDALLQNVPLTKNQLDASDGKIIDALYDNAQTLQTRLEDYVGAINTYDTLNSRFPANNHLEDALAGLYYCYTKLGRKASADSVYALINTKFKNGKFLKLIADNSTKTKSQTSDSATKAYENVYNLFIEGNFEEAKAEQAKADSMYGNSYWTPQLLYIESVYYVSKRQDSTAITELTALTQKFGNTPLATKAQTMIDVLKRRSQIEAYLTNLKITRLPDDEPSPVVDLNPVENIIEKKTIKRDSVVSKPVAKAVNPTHIDTVKTISSGLKIYAFNPSDSQYVGILLNKVDPVYANETKNAFNRYNQANIYNQRITISSEKLNDSLNVVLLGPFSDAATALIYADRVRPLAGGSIIPWLKPEKYSFTIISGANLDILNNTKDLAGYKALLQKVLPGKF